MIEWNSVISVLGTLGGLLVGYWISSRIEERKEKHEMNLEYQRELKKHMTDVVMPLFTLTQEVFGTMAVLERSIQIKSSVVKGKTLKELLSDFVEANKTLRKFYFENSNQINLLMPYQMGTWVFAPINEKIDRIVVQIADGKVPINEMTQVINALTKYQKNLKKLIGYETKIELEEVYPFSR